MRGHRRRIQRHNAGRPRGPFLLVMPPIRDDYPAELKNALAIRTAANVNGRCQCGGRFRWSATSVDDGGVTHVPMEHENTCPARDSEVERLFREWRPS